MVLVVEGNKYDLRYIPGLRHVGLSEQPKINVTSASHNSEAEAHTRA